jgi:tetratricopeptide (TPR) repeat protein
MATTKLFFLVSLMWWGFNVSAQSRKTDSLLHALHGGKNDTVVINTLQKLAREYYIQNNFDSSRIFLERIDKITGRLLGVKNPDHNFIKKIKNADADCKSLTGNVFFYQGKYPEAMNCHLASLKIYEETKNDHGIASAHIFISNVYFRQNNPNEAIRYNLSALKILEGTGDNRPISAAYNNLGMIYNSLEKHSEALDYYFKALKIAIENNDKQGITASYNNIAVICYYQGNLARAIHYFSESLKVHEELKDKWGLSSSYGNLGSLYNEAGKFKQAEASLRKALAYALEVGDKEQLKSWYLVLCQVYEQTGEFKKAFDAYKLHIAYHDSTVNEENTKKIVQQQMQYDFDKKSAADSIRNAESQKIGALKHQEEINRQRIFTYGGIAGFLIMIIVAGVSYRAFRNKKKANIEIQRQKQLVEEKQREILDSIHYAKRIQNALLTQEGYIQRRLKNLNK